MAAAMLSAPSTRHGDRRIREALAYLAERGIEPDTARRLGLLAADTDTMLGRIVVPDLRDGRAT